MCTSSIRARLAAHASRYLGHLWKMPNVWLLNAMQQIVAWTGDTVSHNSNANVNWSIGHDSRTKDLQMMVKM